jgi:glucokinase
MPTLLAADLGGTKTIVAIYAIDGGDQQLLRAKTYATADYANFTPLLQDFLQAGEEDTPTVACLAIAGPIAKGRAKITNIGWQFSDEELSAALNIPKVVLINDFAAVGYGVSQVASESVKVLQTGELDPAAPIAFLGAGTGLGEGWGVPENGLIRVFPTEGGHVDFAPRNRREWDLVDYLKGVEGLPRVSAENVISGRGILNIYKSLRRQKPELASSEINDILDTWLSAKPSDRHDLADPGAAIGHAAVANENALAVETMDIFIDAYGAEAGNLALKTLCFGGLYIAGGIAAKILPLMESGKFCQSFNNKGEMAALMPRIPIYLTLDPQVGLIGAATYGMRWF